MMLARFWKWLWRRPVSVTPQAPSEEDGRRGPAARARFWAELRAGQREAEAHKAALELGRGGRER